MRAKRLLFVTAATVSVLLLASFLPAAAQPTQPGPITPPADFTRLRQAIAAGIYPDAPVIDVNEPNDSPDSPTPISLNDLRNGLISPAGDVDYFTFWANAGDVILADIDAGVAGSSLDSTLTLYDVDGTTQLAFDDNGDLESDPRVKYTLPADGTYFLKVQAAAHPTAGGPNHFFWLFLTVIDAYEPNDVPYLATPFTLTDRVEGNISPVNDQDYFTFVGQAGQLVTVDVDTSELGSPLYARFDMWAPDGSVLVDKRLETSPYFHVLPADGSYLVRMAAYLIGQGGPECFYSLFISAGQPFLVSAATGGNVAGLPFAAGDILLHYIGTSRWEMYFDASDVGVSRNVSSFALYGAQRLWHSCLLLSFSAKQYLPGLGYIQPQDVVLFCPGAFGPETSGQFQWYLDGSDVGLSDTPEMIDGLSVRGYSDTYVSTRGAFRLPGAEEDIRGRDEDIVRFDPSYSGAQTVGRWNPELTGSQVPGLAAEDITGIGWNNDVLYVSLEDAFNVAGVRGDNNDIIALLPQDDSAYTAELFWNGKADGFAYVLDAFELPVPIYQP